ncbi:MAG: hypothetical protein MZV70_75410 [Desulfobacterales bacterium]|nr:hypothetical protein [Desulfobacterales bacterium]
MLTTFFGGEEILVLAGYLAHRGYLTFTLVVLVAFAGFTYQRPTLFFPGTGKGLGVS